MLYPGSGGAANPVTHAGTLSAGLPGTDQPDGYVYDRSGPVRTLWEAGMFTQASDRRQLEHRADILSHLTDPLTEDLTIAGHPEVVVHVASSAPDTDFFAHLVDDDPDGPTLEVCYGFVRARYRHGLDREQLLQPGQITELRITLGPTAVCFRTGHRLRLEITSSNFPNHDRNHNTGGDDLSEMELVPARQSVHHSSAHLSRPVLPVLEPSVRQQGVASQARREQRRPQRLRNEGVPPAVLVPRPSTAPGAVLVAPNLDCQGSQTSGACVRPESATW